MAETLPPELIPLILSNFYSDPALYPPVPSDSETLHKCATVSHHWQYAAELTSGAFSSLRILSTELPKFEEVMQTRHRRRFLKTLDYVIVLPSYPRNRRTKFETRKEWKRNDAVFTEGICALWRILKGWEDEEERKGQTVGCRLNLRLMTAAKEDVAKEHDDHRLIGARWRHVYLRCARDVLGELPELKSIVGLVSTRGGKEVQMETTKPLVRLHEGWTLVKLAGKFPNLERLNITVQEGDLQLYPKKLRLHRSEFAQALIEEYTKWPNLTEFAIGAKTSNPTNSSFVPLVLHDPRKGPDPLSHVLQHIIRVPTLRKFRCKSVHVLSPTIFDEPSESPNFQCCLRLREESANPDKPKHLQPFQSLEYLGIALSDVTPAGTYYHAQQQLGTTPPSVSIPNYTDFSHLYNLYDKAFTDDGSNTTRKDSESHDDTSGYNTEGDEYPYPPTQIWQDKKYLKDWGRSLGIDQVSRNSELKRYNYNTEAVNMVLRGFIALLRKAPRIERASIDLSTGAHMIFFVCTELNDTCPSEPSWQMGVLNETLVPILRELKDDIERIGSTTGEPTTEITADGRQRELLAIWPNCISRRDMGLPPADLPPPAT